MSRTIGDPDRTDRTDLSDRSDHRSPITVNIRRVGELTKLGLMQPPGLEAFERRREHKSSIYAYENAPRTLDAADQKKFRAQKKAWEYFNNQAPSYRRVAIYWVMSPKKAETRARRLAALIDDSAQGKRLDAYTLRKKSGVARMRRSTVPRK